VKREAAAIEREGTLGKPIIADDLNGAMDADHELRTAPVGVFAPLGVQRGTHREKASTCERYMGSFCHHHLAIVAGIVRKLQQSGIGEGVHQGTNSSQ
jgi:hypothetical protein